MKKTCECAASAAAAAAAKAKAGAAEVFLCQEFFFPSVGQSLTVPAREIGKKICGVPRFALRTFLFP